MLSVQPQPSIKPSVLFFQNLAKGSYESLPMEALDGPLSLHEKAVDQNVKLAARHHLKPQQLGQAIGRLNSRQIAPVRIALGILFFFLIIPALLAWHWHQINLKVEKHVSSLTLLAAKIQAMALKEGPLTGEALPESQSPLSQADQPQAAQLGLEKKSKKLTLISPTTTSQLMPLQETSSPVPSALVAVPPVAAPPVEVPPAVVPLVAVPLVAVPSLHQLANKVQSQMGCLKLDPQTSGSDNGKVSDLKKKIFKFDWNATLTHAVAVASLGKGCFNGGVSPLKVAPTAQLKGDGNFSAAKTAGDLVAGDHVAGDLVANHSIEVIDTSYMPASTYPSSYQVDPQAAAAGETAPAPFDVAQSGIVKSSVAKSSSLSGIENAGNSCYMASALQLLHFQPSLHFLLTRKIPKKEYLGPGATAVVKNYEVREKLQLLLRNILDDMEIGNNISASTISELLAHMHSMGAGFTPWKQSDSVACLRWILDKLLIGTVDYDELGVFPSLSVLHMNEGYVLGSADDLNPGHDLELPLQLSNPMARHTIATLAMATQSVSGDSSHTEKIADPKQSNPFTVLKQMASGKTPMDDVYNLDTSSSLAKQIAPYATKLHSGGPVNQVVLKKKGESYQVGQAFTKTTLANAPDLLMFNLKRFSWTLSGEKLRIAGAIDIPQELDIETLLSENAAVQGSTNYRLSSIIVHSGGAHGGHYYMYQRQNNGSWLCCNDTHVTLEKNFNPSSVEGSYLLAYQRIKKAEL